MADNTTLPGTGEVIAADEIGGVKYQRLKFIFGADGVNDGDVSKVNPFPTGNYTDPAYVDTTTTPLAGSATYTSPTWDTTVSGPFVSHSMQADQDGSHIFEVSPNGSTWYIIDNDPIPANTLFFEEHYANLRYSRVRFVNGATPQTTFMHQHVARHFGVPHRDNTVFGDKTNNNQAPATDAIEGLVAQALSAAPTRTDGNTVLLWTTLTGDLVVTLDGEPVVLGASSNNIGDVDVLTVAGAGTLATNQISVANTATLIVASRAGRRGVVITNHGTTAVYIGLVGVTTTTGILLAGVVGASISIPTTAAVYGIVASGTQTVSFIEAY